MLFDFDDQTASEETDLGYWFDTPSLTPLACHHQLWVWLRSDPTERHYDPEVVECQVLSPWREIDRLRIHHPWPRAERYHFCLGWISINDRKNRLLEFYTFGGELQITHRSGVTLCRFRSPAPIFVIEQESNLTHLFVEEVESVLALALADWDMHQRTGNFRAKLCQAAPLTIYGACLRAVEDHLRPIHASTDRDETRLMHVTERELQQLAQLNLGAAPLRTLDELVDGHVFLASPSQP